MGSPVRSPSPKARAVSIRASAPSLSPIWYMNGLLDIARARMQLMSPRGVLLQLLKTWLPIVMDAGQ